jgi:hypothetical protein
MDDSAALRGRGAARDQFLTALVGALEADESILAAWLGGSLSWGQGDALSDLDLSVVVRDAEGVALCARPWQHAGRTTPERLALFARFGHPAIIHENQNNAPAGGSFTCVIYTSGITVDWVLIPLSRAVRPPHGRVLFDKVGVPVEAPPAPLTHEQRAARLAERMAFFWMMAYITAKYTVRGDIVYAHHLVLMLNEIVREVRELAGGEPGGYRRGALIGTVVPLDDPPAAIRALCAAIQALTPEVVALGATVPEEPMQLIETLLALMSAPS